MSSHHAILAGIESISTVENNAAFHHGTYRAILSIGLDCLKHLTQALVSISFSSTT